MPFLAIYRADISREDFERYRAKVPIDSAPATALSHAYARTADGGLCVVDVWDSLEALSTFNRDAIQPALEALNLPPVTAEILEIDTLAVFPGIEGYKITPRVSEPA